MRAVEHRAIKIELSLEQLVAMLTSHDIVVRLQLTGKEKQVDTLLTVEKFDNADLIKILQERSEL